MIGAATCKTPPKIGNRMSFSLGDIRNIDGMNSCDDAKKIILNNLRTFAELQKLPYNAAKRVTDWIVEMPTEDSSIETAQRPIYQTSSMKSYQESKRASRLLAQCIAELFGTMILVLFGCSAIAQFVLSRGASGSFLSVNLAFGFGALIAVYVAGPISGAHINPAVSIALLSLRSISLIQCITYIVSQFVGAFVAAAMVFGIYYQAINEFDGGARQVTGPKATAGIFGTIPTQEVGLVTLFFDQVLSTALLLIMVGALSNKRNKLVANGQVPLAICFVITGLGASFGYNCGCPINPARDLAPRLFTFWVGYGTEVFSVGNYYFWIPCIGPIFGALLGAWTYSGYEALLKVHISDDGQEVEQARYQVDMQNIGRI